jgi:sarcosine oxidase subunit beta
LADKMNRVEPLPAAADVVVIGEGAIAASATFHLAEAGLEVLMLCGGNKAGDGATGPGLGVVGAVRSSDPTMLDLVVRSVRELQGFEERFGRSIAWDQQGFLSLVPLGGDVDELERRAEALTARGLDARVVAPEDARCPYIDPTRYAGALFVPDAAMVYDDLIGSFLTDAAELRGAQVRVGVPVTAVERAHGGITSVVTDVGTVRTRTVVNCEELRAAEIGAMVGQPLPVRPVKRSLFYTADVDPEPWMLFPYTIDLETDLVLHPAGEGLLFGVMKQLGTDAQISPEWELPDARAAAADRLPALATADVPHGGPYYTFDDTPDGLPLIGRSEAVRGFVYAVGLGGEGFALAPGVGQVVRDLVLGKEPFTDVSGLSADRFGRPTRRRGWFGRR